jgi:hypothetical protein
VLKFSLESLVDRVVDLGCFGTMSEGNKPRTRSVVEGLPGSPSRYLTRSAAGASPKQVDRARRGAIPRAANKKNEEKEGQAYLIIDGTGLVFILCGTLLYQAVPKKIL